MGNEMGNNNTSTLKEEDNTSEAEKKTLLEEVHAESVEKENQVTPVANGKDTDTKAAGLASNDTIELGNETLKENSNADGVKGENQTIPTSKSKDVMKEAAEASDDARIELGKDIVEEDRHADDVEGQNQTIITAEAEAVEEKATGLAYVNLTSMRENDSLEGDTHVENDSLEGDTHVENDSLERDTQVENDSLEGEAHADDVKVENQMHPTAEADAQDKDTALVSENETSELGNDSSEGDTYEDDVNVDHQKDPSAEGKVVQGKPAGVDLDDETSELQKDYSQKDTRANDIQGENAIIPIAEDVNVQEKAITLSSDDQSDVKDSFARAVQETTEIRQAEKSPNAGSVGGENCQILSSSLLESTEEEKQKDLSLKKNLLLTDDHHLDNETSIKQDEEDTTVLTSDAIGISNDAELQESSDVDCNNNDKVLTEPSLQDSELLQRSDLLDTNQLCSLDKDDISEKEMKTQEKIFCGDETDGGDGDEFGCSLRYASGVTNDSPSIGKESNGSPLAKVNYIIDDSFNSQPESAMVDNRLKCDHEEKYMVVYEERELSRSRSKMENLHDVNPGKCLEEPLKEFRADKTTTYDMSTSSNGGCKGEGNIVLPSCVSGITNTDQAEEPKVTGNVHHFEACVNNHKTSDEISRIQKDFMVPEAEVDPLMTRSTAVNCRYEERENTKEKVLEEIDKMAEASFATVKSSDERDMSEQCNSHLVTVDQKESFTLQTSASSIHIYGYQEGNVNHTKIFTATSVPVSDWKQENGSKSFGTTANNLDSSNLTVPTMDLVDDEAFEKEGKDYSPHATSLKAGEITTSKANLPSVPYPNNSILANGGYEAMESITRFSTESNPDNPSISALIQKSPSFNLNLRIEGRQEESDHIPLLHQGKNAIESLSNQTSLNLINSMPHAEYVPCILQREEMPVEEKVVTMERSYSEKFKAPFLCLLKEEEEARLLVMPRKQDNHAGIMKEVKEMESASPKGKEKRNPRPSFFSSCMCCATVTN